MTINASWYTKQATIPAAQITRTVKHALSALQKALEGIGNVAPGGFDLHEYKCTCDSIVEYAKLGHKPGCPHWVFGEQWRLDKGNYYWYNS